MLLALVCLACFTILEFIIYTPIAWRWRRPLVIMTLLGLKATTIALLIVNHSAVIYVVLVCMVYRLLNLYRLLAGRSSEMRLRRVCLRSSTQLLTLQLLAAGAVLVIVRASLSVTSLLVAGGLLVLLFNIILFGNLARSLRKLRLPENTTHVPQRELPTITVAIPARNETHDLEECLQSLVASTYQKLEIIVLDDCSQNRRTPEIIRQFAHDGVRFVAGKVPPDHWLAKNFAYQQLLNEANGELVLFCGVDVRFEPDTITQLVTSFVHSGSSMYSLLPINQPPRHAVLPYLIQPMRYAWELALPRRWAKRPPCVSTCWLATRELLQAVGGFAAFTNAILPERHLAREAQKRHGYRMYIAPEWLDLATVKSAEAQRDTALRTRYPQLHRRPEYALLLGAAEMALLLLPLISLIVAATQKLPLLFGLSEINALLWVIFYIYLLQLTYRRWYVAALLLAPLAILYDCAVLQLSMWRYEFSAVYWKGRNVCLPIMEAIPRLPKMP